MTINELIPINTKKAKKSAVRSFMLFLQGEGVGYEYVNECMRRETAPLCLVALLDKFAMHLASKKGRHGATLASHTVMNYVRQAKNWLLDEHPLHRHVVETRLLEMARTLESCCVKREFGGFTNKATACTKKALRQMVVYLYARADPLTDYQDAALLCVLWYLFGRASDLSLVRKQNLSISTGDVFFIRFIRMKTSDEQGQSIFSDKDFGTCPILALALALAFQPCPSTTIFGNLPLQQHHDIALSPTTPLSRRRHRSSTFLITLKRLAQLATARTTVVLAPTVALGSHSYVNRLLDRISKQAGVDDRLTFHFFRRGGAQHANSNAALSPQWIIDEGRGAWNMTITSKAIAYVFNTPSEDTKVAKVLRGWSADDVVELALLSCFDEQTLETIKQSMRRIFNASHNHGYLHYNFNNCVLEVTTAHLLRHYPSLRQLGEESLAVRRLQSCAEEEGVTPVELLAWSCELRETKATMSNKHCDVVMAIEEHPLYRQQAALINQLLHLNKLLDRRLNAIEASISNAQHVDTPNESLAVVQVVASSQPTKKRKVSSIAYLSETWYLWYAQTPRLRVSTVAHMKQKKSEVKQIVAFMKLFGDDAGFTLNETSDTYRDDVLDVGVVVERRVLAFLANNSTTSRGSTAVLKQLRTLHKAGTLNSVIVRYNQLVAAGKIIDPAPAHTRMALAIV